MYREIIFRPYSRESVSAAAEDVPFFRRLVDDDGIFYGIMQKKSVVCGSQ